MSIFNKITLLAVLGTSSILVPTVANAHHMNCYRGQIYSESDTLICRQYTTAYDRAITNGALQSTDAFNNGNPLNNPFITWTTPLPTLLEAHYIQNASGAGSLVMHSTGGIYIYAEDEGGPYWVQFGPEVNDTTSGGGF